MDTPRIRGIASRSTLLVIAAALAAGAGLYTAQRYYAPAANGLAVSQDQLRSVRLISTPRVLRDYQLTAGDGSAVTADSLRGHWTLVFLGFTHCPDVCPTTLAELAKAQDEWATMPASSRPRVLFVSADPERDTPTRTGEYAAYFHADTIGASGTPAQVAAFAQAMGLVYMKVPLEGGDYSIDHSATLVLLDPQARQAGLVRAPFAWRDIAGDLRLLARESP